MPLSKYFKGSGEKVMKNMKEEYGDKKGESVFYAKINAEKNKLRRPFSGSEKEGENKNA